MIPPPHDDRHRRFDARREEHWTLLGLVFLVVTSALVTRHFALILVDLVRAGATRPLVEEVVFVLIVTYLFWASLLYYVCRLGYLRRARSHQAADRAALETVYDRPDAASLTVLVPSCREEEKVVRQTLLAAALMEYPERRVVLLIDDPPEPADATAAAALRAMRAIPVEIDSWMKGQCRTLRRELTKYERRTRQGAIDGAAEALRVAALYRGVAARLEALAGRYDVADHTDALFVERVLREPARAHRLRATAWQGSSRSGEVAGATDLLREYRRLAGLFAASVGSFERKRFVNLSHAPNKAMNLNSYLGLLGRSFRERQQADGVHLEACVPASADMRVPPAEYVITVDADTLLLSDYALRLTHVMAQPWARRVGVVQTPYTAVPGRPGALERAAGAQTDHQWIMSQGLTRYGATFWIGASALLRYAALADIRDNAQERGFQVARYVRDRTLTEDSESTVHLLAAGWQVHNYLDRLSYSATPPDFGALVVQRRRWANGGLLILPMLLRHLRASWRRVRPVEAVLRTHYLASTAGGSVCVLALLLYPFGDSYTTPYAFGPWLPLMSLPYFVLLARDLASAGYGWRDLLRIHALNLLLVPVHLAGTVASLRQAWTGRPTAFARTPKVPGRTAVSPLYVAMPLALTAWAAVRVLLELRQGHWGHAPFVLTGAAGLVYACGSFIGLPAIREDLLTRLRPAPLTTLVAEGDEA